MGNANIVYESINGFPNEKTLDNMLEVYDKLFDNANLPFFKQRLDEHSQCLSILAYVNAKLVGFKIGYPYSESIFYSWVGGVLPAYRKLGIATKLAEIQESYALQKGFVKLRTKSMNTFKPMMSLNLKNGFDIMQVYTNTKGQTKIIFEKDIV